MQTQPAGHERRQSLTLRQLELGIEAKRSKAKFFGRIVWFSGLLLLIFAFGFLFVEFFRLVAVSKKAGQLADLRAEKNDLDYETYMEKKNDVIHKSQYPNRLVSNLMEENESIRALEVGNSEGLLLLYMVNCIISVLFIV